MFYNEVEELGLLLTGVQEARLRSDRAWRAKDVLLVSSARTDDAGLGCLFVVRCAVELVPGKERTNVREENVSGLLLSPRLFHSTIRAEYLNVDVIVSHAPHNGHEADERAAWWKELACLLRKTAEAERKTLLLADANSRIAVPMDGVCGDYQPAAKQDLNSCEFIGAPAAGRLFLPLTFTCFAEPHDQRTWLSTAGLWHRIDYTAIPPEWRSAEISVAPTELLDVALVKVDHLAVITVTKVEVSTERPERLSRKKLPSVLLVVRW